MTVQSTINRNAYLGTGTPGPFAYGFRIFDATNLLVMVRDALTDLETTLAYIVDYSVTGVGNRTGGTVVLVEALAAGNTLSIRRALPLVQSADIRNQGEFFAQTHEDAFDYAMMVAQALNDGIGRSIRLPETVDPLVVNPTLPVPEASKAIVWNVAGTGLSNAQLSDAQLSAWSASQTQKLDVFTAGFTPGATTQLTLTHLPGNLANVWVTMRISGLNRVFETDEFSIAGTTITFASAIPAGTTRIEVRYFYTYQVTTAAAENIVTEQTGTGAVPVDARSWFRREVWLADFGVAGGGSDETAKVQEALDEAAATNKVVNGGNLVGVGITAITVSGPGIVFDRASHGDAGGPGFLSLGSGHTAITTTGGNIITDWNVSVRGSGNASNGVLFQNPILSFIKNTRVFNLNGAGVTVNKCYDTVFGSISVEQCNASSAYAFSVNPDGDTSNQSHFLRVQVEKAGPKAIHIDVNTLSCIFHNIHSEQAAPTAAVDTWFLGGIRGMYGVVNLESNSPDANATCHINGGALTIIGLLTVGAIDVTLESTGLLTLISPEIQGTCHVVPSQTGKINIQGGNITTMPTDPGFLRVEGCVIGALTIGFANNPVDPTWARFIECDIATLASSSALSAATFDGCVIAEGGNLLRGATVLINSTVTCASAVAHSSGVLIMRGSALNADLTYTNHAALRLVGGSAITGTVSCGDAGLVDFLMDDSCTVGGSSSGVGKPTGGVHLRGARHSNPLPAEAGSGGSKYVVDGWVCTVAGTPGTWLDRRTLTGN